MDFKKSFRDNIKKDVVGIKKELELLLSMFDKPLEYSAYDLSTSANKIRSKAAAIAGAGVVWQDELGRRYFRKVSG